MQPQLTNRSIYSSQIHIFTKSTRFFTISSFFILLRNAPSFINVLFFTANYNLCNFEGHWILVAVGCNPDIFLRNLLDLSFSWQFSNVRGLLERYLSMHHYFQVYWLGCIPEGDAYTHLYCWLGFYSIHGIPMSPNLLLFLKI